MIIPNLLRQAFHEWMRNKAPRMGAALAFYTVFSLAPLLIIVISVSSFFFGQSTAQGEIISQIRELIGREGANTIETLIVAAKRTFARWTFGYSSWNFDLAYWFHWSFGRIAGWHKPSLECSGH